MEDDKSIERIKLRNELIRFFFGTFLIAILTLGFNALLKYWDLESEKLKLKMEVYERYLDRFDQTKDKVDKLVLAKTLSSIAPDEDLRNGYNDVYKFLEKSYGKINDLEKDKLIKETKREMTEETLKSTDSQILEQFKKVAEKLDNPELSDSEASLSENEYQNIVASNPEIKKIIDLDNEIQQTETQIDKTIQEGTIPVEVDLRSNSYINKSGWFKEGYMVTYDNVRIRCDEIDSKNKVSKIRVQTKNDNDFETIGTFYIQEGRRESIDNGKYVFEYKRTGSAGKNPFTKAVYFDFSIKK